MATMEITESSNFLSINPVKTERTIFSMLSIYQNVKFLTGSRGPHGPDLPSPFARKFQLFSSVSKMWPGEGTYFSKTR